MQRAPKRYILDFEQPIVALEDKIAELKQLAIVQNVPADDEVKRLTEKADKLRSEIFSKLTAWEQVQLARHPLRPYTLDYIDASRPSSSSCTATVLSPTTRPSSAGS